MTNRKRKAAVVVAFLIINTLFTMSVFSKNNSHSDITPDFAFPRTVMKSAENDLREGIKNHDSQKAFRALMNLIISQNIISQDSITDNLQLIDETSNQLQAPYNDLCRLLKANVLWSFYQEGQYTYNNRKLPLEGEFPENPSEWSGNMFAKSILQIIVKQNEDITESWKQYRLKDFKEVINVSSPIASDMSLYDFFVFNSYKILKDLDHSGEKTIPFYPEKLKQLMSEGQKAQAYGNELLQNLIKTSFNEKNYNIAGEGVLLISKSLDREETGAYLYENIKKIGTNEGNAPLLISALEEWFYFDDNNLQQIIKITEEWLEVNKTSDYYSRIKYLLEEVTNPFLSLSVSNCVLPDKKFNGKLRFKNSSKGYLYIYKLKECDIEPNGQVNYNTVELSSSPLHKIELENKNPQTEQEIELPELSAGHYLLVTSFQSKLPKGWLNESHSNDKLVINVTDISILVSKNQYNEKGGKIFVVRADNQKPIEGARVSCFSGSSTTKFLKSFVTDKNGCVEIDYKRDITIQANYQNSSAHYNTWLPQSSYNEREEIYASFITDMSIYRPGDKMEYALIAWCGKDGKMTPLGEKQIVVELKDANYKNIGNSIITTDEFGRGKGTFILPDDKLKGTYSLTASIPNNLRNPDSNKETINVDEEVIISDDNIGRNIGSCRFEVDDYKVPGFYVKVEQESENGAYGSSYIVFKGKAETFAGMAIVGGKVTGNVDYSPYWIRFNRFVSANYRFETETDIEGNFEVKLPLDNVLTKEYKQGVFSLSVTVTSQSGESQTSNILPFIIEEKYEIKPSVPFINCIEGDTIAFNVPVYNQTGNKTDVVLNYKFTNKTTGEAIDGEFNSGKFVLKSELIKSGEYLLEFYLKKDEECSVSQRVVFYRKKDERPPYETELWLPENYFVISNDSESVHIPVGSSYPGSWIYYAYLDSDLKEVGNWIEIEKDNKFIELSVAKDVTQLSLVVRALHNFHADSRHISIIRESKITKPEITIESFREKLKAGTKERWKFKFNYEDEGVVLAPVLAVMTDKAMNGLVPFKWNLSPYCYKPDLSLTLDGIYSHDCTLSCLLKHLKSPYYIRYELPTWQTYGQSLSGRYYIYESRSMMKANYSAASFTDGIAEESDVESPLAETTQLRDTMPSTAGGIESGEGNILQEDSLRPIEMPIVFFRPDLLTDKDGEVEIEFEVPDFNTTWQFQLAAYDKEMKAASLVLDAVASKPIMVKSNFPMFMRTGDKAEINGMIYNNADSSLGIEGAIEVINPGTGEKIISYKTTVENLDAKGSRHISYMFEVPDNLNEVEVRIYGKSGNSSDGEGSIIPIYPSSTPVIESETFYLNPDQTTFNKFVEVGREKGITTLKYCNNPLLETLLMLSSLKTEERNSALGVSFLLSANMISTGLVKNDNNVNRLIESIAKEDNKDLFKGNLENDRQLKAVNLESTPWINNAENQTKRIFDLTKYLDLDFCEKEVDSQIEKLISRQNSNGSFSWFEGMKPSFYITEGVLSNLACANYLGYLSPELITPIKKAIEYCDKEIVENYQKSKDKAININQMVNYLFARESFDVKSSNSKFDKIKSVALEKIKKEWRSLDLFEKAKASIVLGKEKDYQSTVKEILESLSQMAVRDENKGWCFDNLKGYASAYNKLSLSSLIMKAFMLLDPENPCLKGLSQWILLQSQTQDYGEFTGLLSVVAVMADLYSDYDVMAGNNPEIFINGIEVEKSERMDVTGEAAYSIPSNETGKVEITIKKNNPLPAWGGVISQYVADIESIKESYTKNLKIKKDIKAVKTGKNGETFFDKEIRKGDRVRTFITIEADNDMDYIFIKDERGACLIPENWLSGMKSGGELWYYEDITPDNTSFFIDYLPKGTHILIYDSFAENAGEYANGIVSIASLYSPEVTAHSAGRRITIKQ